MEKSFGRQITALEEIFAFVQSCFDTYGIDNAIDFPVKFIIEEIFTNMVKYNRSGTKDILIAIDRGQTSLTVSLTDYDGKEFVVSQSRDVDMGRSLKGRRIGGLGVLL